PRIKAGLDFVMRGSEVRILSAAPKNQQLSYYCFRTRRELPPDCHRETSPKLPEPGTRLALSRRRAYTESCLHSRDGDDGRRRPAGGEARRISRARCRPAAAPRYRQL